MFLFIISFHILIWPICLVGPPFFKLYLFVGSLYYPSPHFSTPLPLFSNCRGMLERGEWQKEREARGRRPRCLHDLDKLECLFPHPGTVLPWLPVNQEQENPSSIWNSGLQPTTWCLKSGFQSQFAVGFGSEQLMLQKLKPIASV